MVSRLLLVLYSSARWLIKKNTMLCTVLPVFNTSPCQSSNVIGVRAIGLDIM